MPDNNFYGFTGKAKGCQTGSERATVPTTFAATVNSAIQITLTWDETLMVGHAIRIERCEGTVITGTVTTNGTTTIEGVGTQFVTDGLKAGDVLLIAGETPRVIASVTDLDTLILTVAASTSAGTLGAGVANVAKENLWTYQAQIGAGVETYANVVVTATYYFYRYQTLHRFKWTRFQDSVIVGGLST